MAPGLYVVATPIGHLDDVTLRALKVLAAADLIYCEDTRITRRLLERYAIAARPRVYDDHRGHRVRPGILAALDAGRSVALVSDAGTPLISDPGFKLVRAAREEGHAVFTVPGPSALTAAAAVAGIATDRLHFAGFLPARPGPRRHAIAELATIDATLVLYEAPGRLAAALADLAAGLGDREAAVARELTKLHEDVVRAPVGELARRYAATAPKGEVVILVAAPARAGAGADAIDAALGRALAGASLRDAAAAVAAELGVARSETYRRALALQRAVDDDGPD